MLKNIYRFLKKNLRTSVVLLTLNLLVLGIIGITNINTLETLQTLENLTNIQIMNQIQQKKNYKSVDLYDVEKIQEANLLISNETAGIFGAGTHIKYKGKNYILSCAHLIVAPEDKLIAIENANYEIIELELVHYDKKVDLALFKTVTSSKHIASLQISNVFPKAGSEVTVIGNPSLCEDIITNGIISKIKDKFYVMTNIVYSGNSGGAVLYKGKIVGVLSAMSIMVDFPKIATYSIAVNLKTIQNFLIKCNLE